MTFEYRFSWRDLPAEGDTAVTVTEAGDVCLWSQNVRDGSLMPVLLSPAEAVRAARSMVLAASVAETVRRL